jgi:hypothetical protein
MATLQGEIPMTRPFVLTLLLFCLMLAPARAQAAKAIESGDLIVRDPKGLLSAAQLADFAEDGRGALEALLQYWSTSARSGRFGKIRLEYNRPRWIRDVAVFSWRKEKNKRVRVVAIWGKPRHSEMMVQKLTHAVFPNRDKLVRNMMGIPTEAALGNPLSFPMCGFDIDAWVLALRRANALVPLAELGPSHESWGMGTRDGLPYIKDAARQQVTYAEAGSFGRYLIDTYGIAKVKAFNVKAASGARPWKALFGASLGELEAGWLRALAAAEPGLEADIRAVAGVWKRKPARACPLAQEQAAKKGVKPQR